MQKVQWLPYFRLFMISNKDVKDIKMAKKSHHVVPNPKGGWNIKKGGAEKASNHFDLKQEAIDAARIISQNQKTELVIHNKDGKISQSDSHGNDPHPPKDKDPKTNPLRTTGPGVIKK
jgi:hypothetical protein